MSIETITEKKLQSEPILFQKRSESDRLKARKQLDEISQAPHPGRLARKLRKQRGMTVEDLADVIDAEPWPCCMNQPGTRNSTFADVQFR